MRVRHAVMTLLVCSLHHHLTSLALASAPAGLLVEDVLAFVDGGGSVLVVGSGGVSRFLQDLAGECGVEYDPPDSVVVDHFHHDVMLGQDDHATIVSTAADMEPTGRVVGELTKQANARILYQGIGLAFDADAGHAFSVLSGSPTAYASVPTEVSATWWWCVGTLWVHTRDLPCPRVCPAH